MTSLVLVPDVEGVLTSRSLAKGAQWLSPIFLASVEAIVVLHWLTAGGFDIQWATVLLAVIGAGVGVALRTERAWLGALSVIVASGGGTYLLTLSLHGMLAPDQGSDSLPLSLVKVAVVVAGVGGRSLRSCLILCSLGFGLTGAASIVAARHTGLPVAFDVPAFGTYAALVALILVLWWGRRGAARGAPAMNRAGSAVEMLAEEARIMALASSTLHDTVLNDLRVLALTPPGPLSDARRELIQGDLTLLAQNEGLLLGTRDAKPTCDSGARPNPLAPALAHSRDRGLVVTMTGDPAALAELPSAAEQAVLMAVDQCLVNVSLHAGVDRADLSIAVLANEVTVLITDAGHGFDPGDTDPRRLGLRLSVQERIRAVGGEVQVWSRPSAGTAILLTVPKAFEWMAHPR